VFQRIYDSPWHHPTACLVAAAALLLWWPWRRPLGLLAPLLALEIAADAWLTSAWSPLDLGSPVAAQVAVLFVILGDRRWFYLLLRQRAPRGPAIALAFGASLAVPALAFGLQHAWPNDLPTPRHLFLVYELLFAGVAGAALLWARRLSANGPAGARVKRWLIGLCAFELAQYLGWAIADLVILTAGDTGYLLRIAPNLLYYALFVPFAAATAPDEART